MTFIELFEKINDLGEGMHHINNIDVQVYNHLHQANFLVAGHGCNVAWDSFESPTVYRVLRHIADYDRPIHFDKNDTIPAWCIIPAGL